MATYRVEFADLREWLWKRYGQIGLFYSPAIVGALVIALWLSMSRSTGAGFFAGLAVAWLATGLATVRDVRARSARLCQHYSEPVTVAIAPDALGTESVHGSGIVRKSGVVRVHAFSRSFAIEYPSGNAQIVPRRYLSGDELAVLEAWAHGSTVSSPNEQPGT